MTGLDARRDAPARVTTTGEAGGQELFDPEFLDRLRALFFRLRKRRQLRKKGAEASRATGFTREFKDHRHYTPGDDFRSIDWRLYARLERLFIRLFEEIQEYHVHVLVDRSGSMAEPFGGKRTAALRLAVALSYLGLVGQHRVSVLTVGDGVRREMPPMKGQGHVHEVIARLSALEFGGLTDLAGSFARFRPGRDRRGITFVVSDLFGRSEADAVEAVRHLARWPSESHVIHVFDPGEREPGLQGEVRLVDVESGETRRMWLSRRELALHAESFDRFADEVRRSCMRWRVDLFPWATTQPFEETFLGLLMRGSALAEA